MLHGIHGNNVHVSDMLLGLEGRKVVVTGTSTHSEINCINTSSIVHAINGFALLMSFI